MFSLKFYVVVTDRKLYFRWSLMLVALEYDNPIYTPYADGAPQPDGAHDLHNSH